MEPRLKRESFPQELGSTQGAGGSPSAKGPIPKPEHNSAFYSPEQLLCSSASSSM